MKPYEPYSWKEEVGAWLLVVILMLGLYYIIQAYETHDTEPTPTITERKVKV